MQSTNEYVTDFGHLHLRIEEILKDRGISKSKEYSEEYIEKQGKAGQ